MLAWIFQRRLRISGWNKGEHARRTISLKKIKILRPEKIHRWEKNVIVWEKNENVKISLPFFLYHFKKKQENRTKGKTKNNKKADVLRVINSEIGALERDGTERKSGPWNAGWGFDAGAWFHRRCHKPAHSSALSHKSWETADCCRYA